MREVQIDPDALVIRFAPVTAENVLRRAGLAHRRRAVYASSVFAGVKDSHEDDDALRARLLEASQLHGIEPVRNSKYWVCARARDLLDLGFVFMKDGDDDEAPEHFSVCLGDSPTVEDVERFLGAFTTRERRPQ